MKLAYGLLAVIALVYMVPDLFLHHLGIRTPKSYRSGKCSLTFDDGPDAVFTPLILDALKQRGGRATFFVVGKKAASMPKVMARIAAEGHEIGLHGWDHRHPWLLGPVTCRRHLERAAAAIASYREGTAPARYRPPWGYWSLWTLIGSAGHPSVMWSLPGDDWKADASPESIAALVSAKVREGSIVLLHDGAKYSHKTASALTAILDGIEKKGLKPVTLSELLEGADEA